jgi:3',5'-cyclic AMP phosphodiesterase CpdA
MNISYLSRRGFLRSLVAGGMLAGSPALARYAWKTDGSQRGTLRLVFFTDVHARTEWETPEAVAKAAEAINILKPDLVLGGGDLITDGFEALPDEVAHRWDVYMSMHNAIADELHVAIGNHDLVGALPKHGAPPVEDPRSEYKRHLGLKRTFYSFDVLGYHVLLLDSVRVSGDEYKYHGFVSAEQIDWIKADLSHVPRETPIVLVLHIPLVTAYYATVKGATFQAKPNRVTTNNVEVLKLFENRNLALVLQGHSHVAELVHWRQTAFLTGGAVCGKWWRGPYHGTQEGFNLITLHQDRIEWEYIDYGWTARRPRHR